MRVGDFELHPGVGSEVGYYTNPFFSDRPQGSAAFRIAPHLFISTLGEQRQEFDPNERKPGWLAFSGGLSATFQHYFEYAVRDAFNLDLRADATLAPERPLSLHVGQLLQRSAVPFGDTAVSPNTTHVSQAANYTNYYENANVQLIVQSPGGLLRGSVGYRFGYAWFDSVGFLFNNNMTHSAMLNLSWEFLPKTALFYDATYSYQNYLHLDDQTLANVARTQLVNNEQVSTRLGVNGAITSRIGATVALGYAAGFYAIGDDPSGIIGNLELRYTPSPIAEVALTLDRTFLPSYQGNFQARNRIYARARWLFVGAFMVVARAGVEHLRFGYDNIQMSGRQDWRYFADLSGEYRFVDWLAVTAQFNVLVDDTDFVYLSVGDLARADPAKFKAIEAWLGLRAFL